MTPVRLAQVLEVLYVCESNFEYKVLLNCCCLLMCCAVYMKTVACTGCVAIVVVDINVDRGAEYCDERFCLCVCARVCVCLSVHDHVFGTTGPIFTKFFLHVIYGHGHLWASLSDGVLVWLSVCGARCRLAYGPADTTATHCLLLQ